MSILHYENLTYQELAGLPRDKTVVFFPTGPLEEHGPHLPLGVDAFSGEFFSVRMSERLQKDYPDWNFIIFPTLFAGCDTLTYPGTVEVRPWILREFIYDCCKDLARNGFRNMIAVSGHGGPRNMVLLEEVAAKMRWRHRVRMISASSKVLLEILRGDFVGKIVDRMQKNGTPMTEAEKQAFKKDYHGGLLETSLMMVAKSDLVKPVYKELRPALIESVYKLRRSSGKTVGEGLGYLGSPAQARAEIGVAVTETLIDDLMPLMHDFLDGKNVNKQFRSKFYYIPFFRSHFRWFMFFLLWVALMIASVVVMNHMTMEMFR